MTPSGWSTKTLQDLCSKPVQYGIVQAGDHVPGGVPYVRVVDLSDDEVSSSRMLRTSDAVNRAYARTILEKGEVLFVLRGDIGHVVEVTNLLVGANISRGVARLAPRTEIVSGTFLNWALQAPATRDELLRRVNGSALQEIPIHQLRKLRILVPPAEEQAAISHILEHSRRAEVTIARSLRHYLLRRAGLQQQLLTCKRRFPGPWTKWDEVAFRDVFDEKQERNVGSCVRNPITVGKYAIAKQSEKYRKSVTSEDVSNYWVIRRGDFVYDPMSAYYGAIGRYDLDAPGIVSPAYRVQTLKSGFDSDFIKYVVKSHYVLFQLEAFSSQNNQTGKRRLLQRDAFGEVSFPCPEITEQRLIAGLLMNADREIAVLERLLATYRRQKKGLMQQLLTGKRRVGVPAISSATG